MNFKDKKNYAKKLLTDTFGKPIYSADWAFAAWNVKGDIFITEEEDGGFLLVKRDMELYNGDSDYVFDELYSSQSVNKVIAEAKKYMKGKQLKGLGMNFKDKADYARKLLNEAFGKPLRGGGADWISDTWQVNNNDIFIQEDEDNNFILFRHTQIGEDYDGEFENDELYSSQSVNKVIAEAKKYTKGKQLKGLGMITESNYFTTITPVLERLPEWAKQMHDIAIELNNAGVDPFTELEANEAAEMQELLKEANKIAMASERKPEPKPAFKRTKPKAGVKKAVTKAKGNKQKAIANMQNKWVEKWLEELKKAKKVSLKLTSSQYSTFSNTKVNNDDFPIEKLQYLASLADDKKIMMLADDLQNNFSKMSDKDKDIYFKKLENLFSFSLIQNEPAASSKKPAAKTAKAPSAAQIASREKFAKMANDKAKGKPAAKKAAAKKVAAKKVVTKKVAVKKVATKKPEAAVVRNIKSVEIQHITKYVNLDGKNKPAISVINLAKQVGKSRQANEYLQHISVMDEISTKLNKAHKAITEAKVDTVNFEIDKAFKAKLTAILKNVKVRVQTNVLAGVKKSAKGEMSNAELVKKLVALPNNTFADDYAYATSGNLDRILAWIENDYEAKLAYAKKWAKIIADDERYNPFSKNTVLRGVNSETDLFDNFEDLPKKVQDILDLSEDEQTYDNCELMLKKLKPLGYTFEYGLDAIPYNLKKISNKGTKKKSLNESNHNSKIKNQKSLSGVTSATDMLKQNYKTIDLGPYKKYFGEVAHNFDMMLHGEPGVGKTFFLLKFANWYANNIGDVLFVSDEEYGTVTLQNKIAETNSNSPNLYFSKSMNGVNISNFALVIADSINSIGITLEQYIALRTKNPNTAFIGILQKTKDGNFRGGKEWEHEFEIAGELIFNEKNQRCIKTYKNRYGVLDTQKI